MFTRLVHALTRRIGNWIVELSETHLTIRRAHRKTCIRIALADLVAALDQVKPPRHWIPVVGEVVAVLPNRHRALVQSVMDTLPEITVRIRFPKGREKSVYLSKLVPADISLVLVACERISKDGTTESESESTLFRPVA